MPTGNPGKPRRRNVAVIYGWLRAYAEANDIDEETTLAEVFERMRYDIAENAVIEAVGRRVEPRNRSSRAG